MSTTSKLIAALAVASAFPAAAQNRDADPNYGTVSLAVGFTPDPRVMAVESGGPIDASSIGSPCAGFISEAPDVRLNYTGGSLPLIISVDSGTDTTLVVNAPDGAWHCDDDGGTSGLNPMLRFDKPATGRYEIWIGTYGNSSFQAAELHISELRSR